MTETGNLENPIEPMCVRAAIEGRIAVRRFTAKAVPEATVRDILHTSSHAPSGANLQPWRVYALAGAEKAALCARMQSAFRHEGDADADAHVDEYDYYPDPALEPFAMRKRLFGRIFYGALGIRQDDREARARQTARNYDFFGAPVGLVFTVDRRLGPGSWLDYGMFLQNVMLAARGHGLDTCPQVSVARFHRILRERLPIPAGELVVCGMALGHADTAAPELAIRQPRIPVGEFASFHGFPSDPA